MANATRQNDGRWVPRIHLADFNDPPKFATEAEALDCHASAWNRVCELATQLGCVKSRAAIAATLKNRGLFERISKARRSDLRDDAGIDARHYLSTNGEVCNVTIGELEALEIFA